MSLRFIDGFDHYATADLATKWTAVTSVSGYPSVAAVAARFGGGGIDFGNLGALLTKTLDAQASWVVGVAVKVNVAASASTPFVVLLDAGTAQVDLRLNPDNTLSVTRNGAALSSGTSTFALTQGVWCYVEWKVTIADSITAGSCKVRVNGADVITVATGQDTKSTANATANQVRLKGHVSLADALYLDDLYVADGQGSVNNDFLGDCRVETLYPSGAGTTTQLTPDSGSNYARVNEASQDGDTSYVESATVGQKDTYALSDPSGTPSAVFGLQTCLWARKTDAGSRGVAPAVRSGGADYTGATVSLANSYACYTEVRETDPATAVAWTASGVAALEVGMKIIS